MLNSRKKFRVLRDKKNNILTLVLSEKKILNETKYQTPPFKLNGRSLTIPCCSGGRNICCVIVPKIVTSFV